MQPPTQIFLKKYIYSCYVYFLKKKIKKKTQKKEPPQKKEQKKHNFAHLKINLYILLLYFNIF